MSYPFLPSHFLNISTFRFKTKKHKKVEQNRNCERLDTAHKISSKSNGIKCKTSITQIL